VISGLLLAAALHAPPVSARAKAVPVEVHADAIEYRYKERRTIMTGKPLVTLTRQDATLECRRVAAELDEAGRIVRATCEGDVRLTRGERRVTCERARFEAVQGRVTCEGSPELRDGESLVKGEVLVYDLDEDRVTLTRAKGTVVQTPAGMKELAPAPATAGRGASGSGAR
jgi:lipopolysaccharide transport protein LptA